MARTLLWERCQGEVAKTVRWENRRHHLPAAELADAQQHLYLAFDRAVRRYNPRPDSHGRVASFVTFLHVVVAHAFANYCACWRTYHRHIAVSEVEEDGRLAGDFGVVVPVMPEAAQEEEESGALAPVLAYLTPAQRRLMRLWLHVGNDREVACTLGITTEAARQRRERLVRRLRQKYGCT